MPLGALLGLFAFVAFSLLLGARMFRLALRSGGLPELALAVAFTVSGGFGAALQAVGPLGLGSEAFQWGSYAAVRVTMHVGLACPLLFTWRVFRPSSRAAAAAFAALLLGSLAVLQGYAHDHAFGDPMYRGPWFWAEAVLYLAGFSWCAAEPLRYHRRMLRRQRLGLAEPLVVNRFLLWGLAYGGAAGAILVPVAFELLGLANETGPIAGLAACFALVSVVAYALAFFPPRRYGRWLERRAARRAEAQSP
jgi:hypothetical protein